MRYQVDYVFLLVLPCVAVAFSHQHATKPGYYQFSYGVNDPYSKDNKHHNEEKDGHVVKGSYSLDEPDGTKRVVDYVAGPHKGFQAIVKKIGTAYHPVTYGKYDKNNNNQFFGKGQHPNYYGNNYINNYNQHGMYDPKHHDQHGKYDPKNYDHHGKYDPKKYDHHGINNLKNYDHLGKFDPKTYNHGKDDPKNYDHLGKYDPKKYDHHGKNDPKNYDHLGKYDPKKYDHHGKNDPKNYDQHGKYDPKSYDHHGKYDPKNVHHHREYDPINYDHHGNYKYHEKHDHETHTVDSGYPYTHGSGKYYDEAYTGDDHQPEHFKISKQKTNDAHAKYYNNGHSGSSSYPGIYGHNNGVQGSYKVTQPGGNVRPGLGNDPHPPGHYYHPGYGKYIPFDPVYNGGHHYGHGGSNHHHNNEAHRPANRPANRPPSYGNHKGATSYVGTTYWGY